MIYLNIIKIILIGFFGLFFFIFSVLMRNSSLTHLPNTVTPEAYGISYESVNFRTPDNVMLSGWLMIKDSNNPMVVICHGLGANRADVLDFAYIFYKAGYNIFMFDFRGHGESQGWYTSFGYLEQRDLEGAIQYLKERPDIRIDQIGVFGISMGGSVAILTAAQNSIIKAVVADSPYIDLDRSIIEHAKYLLHIPVRFLGDLAVMAYRIRFLTDSSKVSPIKAISKISPRAVFIINGAKDTRMHAMDAQKLFDAASEPKELWLVKSAGHLECFSLAGEEYQRRIIEFFQKHLPLRS
jgi:fermentation-respiration switch protein FrsA (DUF1100 family)